MQANDHLTFGELRSRRETEFFAAAKIGDEVSALKTLGAWMGMVSSQSRSWAFLEMADSMEPRLFWRAFHQEWNGFDRIPHRAFEKRLRLHKNFWRSEYMSAEDCAVYHSLPERIIVYRGQSSDAPIGLSWTLNREVAEAFAHGHRGIAVPNPIVIEAMVAKPAVAGLYQDRMESEIVLFSPRSTGDVQIERVESVT